MPATDPIRQLIAELASAALAAGFELEEFGRIKHWPLIVLTRHASVETPATRRVYLSAGIHGDEPAGPQALLQLLRADALPSVHHYSIFPVLNPAGLAVGTRENPDGIDLNRSYENPASEEVRQHLAWIDAHIESNDISLLLHEDWESTGFYVYELNFDGHASHAAAILAAARKHLPIETATEIDGRAASGGIIRPDRIPEDLEGLPEALYLLQKYRSLSYTLETPSTRPLEQRVAAHMAIVQAIL